MKVTQSCLTLIYSPLNSPGQNTEVGSHSLLQGICPTWGLDPGLPHCRWILYELSHQEAQEYWGGEPIPSPGDRPNPGIELGSPALQVDSFPAELPGEPWSAWNAYCEFLRKEKVNYNKVVREKSKFRKEWWTRRLERDSKMGKCFTVLTPQKVQDSDFKVSVALSS